MKIEVGFPDIGMRFVSDEDGFSIEKGFGFRAIKTLKADVVVTEFESVSRNVEIRSRYSENYAPETSFEAFSKRAKKHMLSILAEMNIPA